MRILVPAALATLSLLAACNATLDDVRSEPVRFSVASPVDYRTMANCIAARSMQDWNANVQVDQANGVAWVFIAAKLQPTMMSEFTVRRQGSGSVVEWRRRKFAADVTGIENSSRAIVDRCQST